MTTINIDGRALTRFAAITAATIGVGAAAFFGGQTTRMSDTAVAREATGAVKIALAKAESKRQAELVIFRSEAKQHERRAVRSAKRATRKNERRRAAKLAERARNQGYSSGNANGFSAGHSSGYDEGNSEGYDEGLDDASDALDCSDDPDVTDLPYC